MKKLLIGILFLVSIFCLMAEPGELTQKDSSYEIIENNRTISVIYYGPEYLNKYEEEQAIIEMREPKELLNSVQISVRVSAPNIEDADPANWLFILQDGNKQELYRNKGDKQIPRRGEGIWMKTWASYHYILLKDEPVEFPLYLRVVNPQKVPIDITIMKK
jgi:hypothetical protein